MTIEKYLEMSAAELEAMSDAEQEKHFSQYLPLTRPELQPKEEKKQSGPRTYNSINDKKRIAEQILFEALGKTIKL